MPSDSLTATARGSAASAPRPVPSGDRPREGYGEPVLRRVLDAAVEATVASYALWTVVYWLGLVTQWRLWLSGGVWLATTVGLVGWQVAAAARRPAPADAPSVAEGARDDEEPVHVGLPRRLLLLLVLAGAAASALAVVAAVLGWPTSFPLTWIATVVAAGALGAWAWGAGRLAAAGRAVLPGATRGAAGTGTWADVGVVLVGGASAVLSLFLHLTDTDDPYYLNRAVWVAEHGNAALRDTMFSPEVYNTPYGGGVPIASLEALQGVLAHLVGLRAGTVVYLVTTPFATALSVWALWRLARRWAPARPFVVLVVAVAFLTLSGDSMLGNFWVPRIWQGKVIAVTLLMPLVWAWLTEVAVPGAATADRRRALVLLLLGGVAFAGLTPTAVVWAPVMVGAALLAAVVLGSRSLAVGGLLFLAGPLLSGVAVVLFSSGVGGEAPVALGSEASFVRVLGLSDPMVALALLGLCLAPVAARRGVPAALAGASALLAVLVFAPHVLPLLNAVTGSGPILWRMLYVAPVAVLVGLLAALVLAPLRRPSTRPGLAGLAGLGVRAAVALVLVAGLAVGGAPVWSHTSHTGTLSVTSRPEWKLDLASLRDVRLLDERGLLHGVVVLPPIRMKVLTMYTTDAFGVVPRDWFVQNIHEPAADRRARRLLYRVAAARPPFPPPAQVGAALDRLDVTLACAGPSAYRDDVVQRFQAAGFTDRRTVGSLTCVTPG